MTAPSMACVVLLIIGSTAVLGVEGFVSLTATKVGKRTVRPSRLAKKEIRFDLSTAKGRFDNRVSFRTPTTTTTTTTPIFLDSLAKRQTLFATNRRRWLPKIVLRVVPFFTLFATRCGAAGFSGTATADAVQFGPLSLVSTLGQIRLISRLIVAASAGAIVGWERSSTKHSAGVRTMALVAVGAAAFTICSSYGFMGKYDTSRMASNVASGVGFIGAGVITTSNTSPNKNIVHGLTTAAAIWLSAAVGVLSGAGLHVIAFAVALITVAILRLDKVTKSIGEARQNKHRTSKSALAQATCGKSIEETNGQDQTLQGSATDGQPIVLDTNTLNQQKDHALHNPTSSAALLLDPDAFMDEVIRKLRQSTPEPLVSLHVDNDPKANPPTQFYQDSAVGSAEPTADHSKTTPDRASLSGASRSASSPLPVSRSTSSPMSSAQLRNGTINTDIQKPEQGPLLP